MSGAAGFKLKQYINYKKMVSKISSKELTMQYFPVGKCSGSYFNVQIIFITVGDYVEIVLINMAIIY